MQVNSFRAYEFSLANLYQMKHHNFLITIGVSRWSSRADCHIAQSDEENIIPTLKVWKMDKVVTLLPDTRHDTPM